MLPSDLSHLTPSQVDDLRRKLAAAGCQPPPDPGTISELHDAFALLRRRHGLAPSNAIDADTLRCLDLDAGLLFGEVLRDELDLLRPASSEALDAGVPPDRARLRARLDFCAMRASRFSCSLALITSASSVDTFLPSITRKPGVAGMLRAP